MKNSTWLSKGLPLLSLLFLVCLWQILSFFYKPVILPSPIETLQALHNLYDSGKLFEHASNTIVRGLAGFALAVVVGVPLGLFMGLNSVIGKLIQPYVVTIQVIPIISWLVLAMIWFGSDKVPIFVVFITTLPLVIINIVQGVQNVNPHFTEMAKLFLVDKKRLIFEVYLPQVIPYLIAAMSAALGTTWKAVAMAEFLSAHRGIGAGMHTARTNLETPEVFAWTLLLVVLGLLTDRGLQAINKRLSTWRYAK
ncbi:ABC transporter permease [Desulfofalx alkaliphila]|uniref:ABC transporter permease n=1 Tax=Desulfofalx alkaliphila TaxID=105483 RepID=UPI0004E26506|nr:ABC transporter permease [Desulfofalx alkaliphila]